MNKKILILGDAGLIGRGLTEELNKHSYVTEGFDLKNGLDINDDKNLNRLRNSIETSDFVFFLAFDVGGANYLSKYEHTFDFISNNVKMMERVFSLLEVYNKEFVFISSMMTKMPQSTYGMLKSIGERYTKSINGVSVRFWNVYGPEHVEPGKNHVITDFIMSALTNNEIKCMTDGSEVRQFIHTEEAAIALRLIMENFDKARKMAANDLNCVDVTNNAWTSIKELANTIKEESGCSLTFSEAKDKVQKNLMIEANTDIISSLGWQADNDLRGRIRELIKFYKE